MFSQFHLLIVAVYLAVVYIFVGVFTVKDLIDRRTGVKFVMSKLTLFLENSLCCACCIRQKSMLLPFKNQLSVARIFLLFVLLSLDFYYQYPLSK